MPVVAICCSGPKASGRITWLFEDIWIDNSGNAQLYLEAIVRQPPRTELTCLRIFLPYEISQISDETPDCIKREFLTGYTECWPAVYSHYQADPARPSVTINNLRATVGAVHVRLVSATSNCSEIEVNFDSPVEGEARIFRLAFMLPKFVRVRSWVFRKAEKHIVLYTYGLAPFGGGIVLSTMRERDLNRTNVYQVEKHHVQVTFWGANVFTDCNRRTAQIFQSSECRNPDRFCPPIERQSLRTGVPVAELRKGSNSYLHWVDTDVGVTSGSETHVIFCESAFQRWLRDHWLAITGVAIATSSLTLSIMRWLL